MGRRNLKKVSHPGKKKQPRKAFEVHQDPISKRMVLQINDAEGMFPLLLKVPFARSYEIVRTKADKLTMR
jgi:hypothetical protein